MIELGAIVAAGVATIMLAAAVGRLRVRLAHAQRRRAAALAIRAEAQRLQLAECKLGDAQRLSEAAVSGGTAAVQAIHKGIAAIPFAILESIPAARDTTRIVRSSHDLISDAVYGTIKAVNSGIGAGLRAGIDTGAKKTSPGSPAEGDAAPGASDERA